MSIDCKTLVFFASASDRQYSNERSGGSLKTARENGERRYKIASQTGLNNACAYASCHGASDCARPKYHNNPYENGGVFKTSRVDPGFL